VAASVLIGIGLYTSGFTAPGQPVVVELSSLRGSEAVGAPAPARVPLNLNFNTTRVDGRSGFRIHIVTAVGDPAWDGPLNRSAEGKPTVRLEKGLSAGSYWVRLYDPSHQLLQEYGLDLH
jgi:hypothetical protein